jgi:hypothetical protein
MSTLQAGAAGHRAAVLPLMASALAARMGVMKR